MIGDAILAGDSTTFVALAPRPRAALFLTGVGEMTSDTIAASLTGLAFAAPRRPRLAGVVLTGDACLVGLDAAAFAAPRPLLTGVAFTGEASLTGLTAAALTAPRPLLTGVAFAGDASLTGLTAVALTAPRPL